MANKGVKITAEPGKQEFFIEREFDAPPELVFRAHTDPKLYAQWIGGSQWQVTIENMDARNGGSYHFIQKESSGKEYIFHGVYHEIHPSDLMIGTFEYDGLPERGHVSLDTTRFEALPGGRTKLVTQSVFQTVEDRDGMIQSGMEEGMNDTYGRLDKLLDKMKIETRST